MAGQVPIPLPASDDRSALGEPRDDVRMWMASDDSTELLARKSQRNDVDRHCGEAFGLECCVNTEPSTSTVDVAIVGAGPTGLYSAYCAGFRGLSTAVIDALPHPGGQVSTLYPEKIIYDIAGHPAIRGQQLVDNLVSQIAPFEPTYLMGHTATTLTKDRTCWSVGTDRGASVSVAAGIGAFTPRVLPCALPYQGRGVTYHIPRLEAHRGQRVVVVGGGDSAIDWALALVPIAETVTLVHRSSRFRAHEHSINQLRSSSVRVLTDADVLTCHGSSRLSSVGIRTVAGEERLPAQALVAALGFTAKLGPIAGWGMNMSGRRISVDRAMRTSVLGVYAAGDSASYVGRVPLIAVSFGEAAVAVNHVAVQLQPEADLAPGHSSDHPRREASRKVA